MTLTVIRETAKGLRNLYRYKCDNCGKRHRTTRCGMPHGWLYALPPVHLDRPNVYVCSVVCRDEFRWKLHQKRKVDPWAYSIE